MRLRQYCYFAMSSLDVPAAIMGEDENVEPFVAGGVTIRRLAGQHQLLGWRLDAALIDFLVRTRAELDVDEYG